MLEHHGSVCFKYLKCNWIYLSCLMNFERAALGQLAWCVEIIHNAV